MTGVQTCALPISPSTHYRERVEAARDRQRFRFRDEPGVHCNAQMPARLLHRYCKPSPRAEKQLERAVLQHGLSARAHDRILKLALSRADLEGHERIEDTDMHLAIDCRQLDRRGWMHTNTHGGPPPRSVTFNPPWRPEPQPPLPEEP